ncbi:uncharacterized protein PHACADRAFT_212323 [Phanerochaete carnosa HHB-10118-sp]|uniref:F-box domain-containing protein n=1 Tax=Phanerochaete carnosa (strain HHB-10118-sp) TaxID=650164 RepID=K5WMY6_PHACS|nr:uncharacterized protein PHACADRAFT_212323 [Phanerochaete carnosa HHB-10118-sp]EKM51692.1 hypothetical protein PHACADRAFT_212323 [Phanerochaete carnosa HHB-10118-sp]
MPQMEQTSSSRVPPLPQELVDRIIDLLHADRATLAKCTLVSQIWSYRSSSYIFGQIDVGTRCLADLITDVKRPHSRLAEHVRRLCIYYQPPDESWYASGVGDPPRLPIPETYSIDISELLYVIREMVPRLSLFSISDPLGQNRYLRVRSDGTLLSPWRALCFGGEVRLTGINAESVVFFLLECRYVKTLSIDRCCVPPYLMSSIVTGARDLQVDAFTVFGDMTFLKYLGPLLAAPSRLGKIEVVFAIGDCAANLARLNTFVASTNHALRSIRLIWTRDKPMSIVGASKLHYFLFTQ